MYQNIVYIHHYPEISHSIWQQFLLLNDLIKKDSCFYLQLKKPYFDRYFDIRFLLKNRIGFLYMVYYMLRDLL